MSDQSSSRRLVAGVIIGSFSVLSLLVFAPWIFLHLFSFFDIILSGWTGLPPTVSWILNGLLLGGALQFSFREQPEGAPPGKRFYPVVVLAGLFVFFFISGIGNSPSHKGEGAVSGTPTVPASENPDGLDRLRREVERGKIVEPKGKPAEYMTLYREYRASRRFYHANEAIAAALRLGNSREIYDEYLRFTAYWEEERKKSSPPNTASENPATPSPTPPPSTVQSGKSGADKPAPVISSVNVNARGQKEMTVDGVVFVYIPGGSFDMGCFNPEDREIHEDALPVHNVDLSGFWLSASEIPEHVCKGSGSNYPARGMTWENARRFAREFGKKNGLNCDLPSEAQWEYAARNRGQNIIFPWGNQTGSDGNAKPELEQFPAVSPVRSGTPTPLSLYNMAGNVWEWCRDTYNENFYYENARGARNPVCQKKGMTAVVRGGSYKDGLNSQKTYTRYYKNKTASDPTVGLRLVLEKLEK